MTLFSDRRTGIVHDLGVTQPDIAGAGLSSYVNQQHDVQQGQASVMGANAPTNPGVPAAAASPSSLNSAWSMGSAPIGQSTSQPGMAGNPNSVLPAQRLRRAPVSSIPGWAGARMKAGPSTGVVPFRPKPIAEAMI